MSSLHTLSRTYIDSKQKFDIYSRMLYLASKVRAESEMALRKAMREAGVEEVVLSDGWKVIWDVEDSGEIIILEKE